MKHVNDIELKIAQNKMTAPQVFTQMKRIVELKNSEIKELRRRLKNAVEDDMREHA